MYFCKSKPTTKLWGNMKFSQDLKYSMQGFAKLMPNLLQLPGPDTANFANFLRYGFVKNNREQRKTA